MDESELNRTLNELKPEMDKYALVWALSSGLSLTDALDKAHRSKGWFYGLPDEEQTRLRVIASELNADPLIKANIILSNATTKAAEVKAAGLDSRNEKIKQDAATDILNRTVKNINAPNLNDVNITVTLKRNDDQL